MGLAKGGLRLKGGGHIFRLWDDGQEDFSAYLGSLKKGKRLLSFLDKTVRI